jgi:iron complex transport system substrate-binding protein
MKLLSVLTCLLLFLSNTLAASGEVVVTDDLGNEVKLAGPAGKIISLAPHLTELLFSLGVGHRIKGTSRYSDYPPAAQGIPVVGDAFSVSVEAVVALQPDIVFAWSTGGANRALERLKNLGYPIYLNEAETIDGIGNTLVAMAELVGRKQEGMKLRDSLVGKLIELRARYAGLPGVQVFFQISDQNLYSVNKHHLIGQALLICNAENIFANESIPVPLVSKESVVKRDPKVIIISRPVEGVISPWVKRWGAYEGYDEKLRWIDPGLISRPSLRMLKGIEQLCRLIHQ